MRLSIVDADCEAWFNAANSKLLHKGGVAKVIADAAGTKFTRECRKHVQDHGLVDKIFFTKGYEARCDYIINVVGPVYDQNLTHARNG